MERGSIQAYYRVEKSFGDLACILGVRVQSLG
jgi:hypothetical protein